MKIRWHRNELRYRVSPAELESLLRGGTVSEAIGDPNGLCASLAAADESAIDFPAPGHVRVALAPADRDTLARPDTEGVYLGDAALRYYVEKDFPCLHPRATETVSPESETFAPTESFLARAEQRA